MNLRELLTEDEDHGTVVPRLLTKDEIKLVRETQALCKVIHKALLKPQAVDEIKHFKHDLENFSHTFPLLRPVITELGEILLAVEKMNSAKGHLASNIDKIKAHNKELKAALFANNRVSSKKHHEELSAVLTMLDGYVDAPAQAKSLIRRHYSAESSFFGTTRLLSTLGDDEYRKIESFDADEPLYTTFDFPHEKLVDDWHFIVFFMINLKTSDAPVGFDSHSQFRTYIKVAHANDANFKELHSIVDRYLHNNDKKLVPRIVELIKLIPMIHRANEARKLKIKQVYRGVGFGDDENHDESTIVKKDKKLKFVATSDSRSAAKNFALQKGHLDSERNSSYGYIIKYKVSPEAILFDTKIIETVYNESEILIDATKAEVESIEDV